MVWLSYSFVHFSVKIHAAICPTPKSRPRFSQHQTRFSVENEPHAQWSLSTSFPLILFFCVFHVPFVSYVLVKYEWCTHYVVLTFSSCDKQSWRWVEEKGKCNVIWSALRLQLLIPSLRRLPLRSRTDSVLRKMETNKWSQPTYWYWRGPHSSCDTIWVRDNVVINWVLVGN